MLYIKNLNAYYDNLHILSNISLHINEGEIITILGANGAGKSTLLNSIMGLVKNKKGEIIFNDKNIINEKTNNIVSTGITVTPEGRQVFPNLSIIDNLMLGAYTRFMSKEKNNILNDINKIFEIFPVLKERKHGYAGYLSGGEQQMLAIGRALMAKPKLLLLDEPSTGLAPKITLQIFDIINELKESENITVAVVEQNAKIALKYADRGYILENGRIILQGDSKDLINNKEVQHAYLGVDIKHKWDR